MATLSAAETYLGRKIGLVATTASSVFLAACSLVRPTPEQAQITPTGALNISALIEQQKAQNLGFNSYDITLQRKQLPQIRELEKNPDNGMFKSSSVLVGLDNNQQPITSEMLVFENKTIVNFYDQKGQPLSSNPLSKINLETDEKTGNLQKILMIKVTVIDQNGQQEETDVPFFVLTSNINVAGLDQDLIKKAKQGDQEALKTLSKMFDNPAVINNIDYTNPFTKQEVKIDLQQSQNPLINILNIFNPLAATPVAGQDLDATPTVQEPTQVAEATPSEAPTPAVPMMELTGIDANGNEVKISVPDILNPEFAKVNPEAAFAVILMENQVAGFAKTFEVDSAEVATGAHVELETPNNSSTPFAVLRTSDGVALMMATQKDGQWFWQKATPGPYWNAQGKVIGVYMDGSEFGYDNNRDILSRFFSEGMVALSGQVRPNADRPPSNALRMARHAHENDMSLFFNYVVEPGKFPKNVDTSNIDSWLGERFDGIIEVLRETKTEGHPMHIVFNEAWEGNSWNVDSNPLRDKYGEKWVEEYTFQLISKFVNAGFVPNKDFVIDFDDSNLYNSPKKQDRVFKTLSEARLNAYNRLLSDPVMSKKLQQMGVNKVEDIDVLLVVQTHIELGLKKDHGIFVGEPTQEEILTLSEKFASLGGIIVEINAFGTTEQQDRFLSDVFVSLKENPNIRGALFWNLFNPDDPGDPWSVQRLDLFDDLGTPTSLFFNLLK